VLTDLPLPEVVGAHRAAGADATIVLTHVEDPTRAGVVSFDAWRRVTRFAEKPGAGDVFSSWANAGVYVCGPAVLEHVAPDGPQDFGRDLFPAMLASGRHLLAYPTEATVIDFGAPERLVEAEAWVRAGREAASPC